MSELHRVSKTLCISSTWIPILCVNEKIDIANVIRISANCERPLPPGISSNLHSLLSGYLKIAGKTALGGTVEFKVQGSTDGRACASNQLYSTDRSPNLS